VNILGKAEVAIENVHLDYRNLDVISN